MRKKLSGTTMVRDGLKYDYCFLESIKSLQQFCDEVIICDAGSTDGTVEILKSLENEKTKVIYREPEEWYQLKPLGKERLNYFSNLAFDEISNEWNYYQQADEITHEDCYDNIFNAINSEFADSYFIKRINLWGSPFTKLNVPQERLPCSEMIVRLAKSKYRTYGDAESIAVDNISTLFFDKIRMYHMGFVRKKDVMKVKVIHMQEDVFQLGAHDVKLDGSNIFISERWFNDDDLIPIEEPLPDIIQEWSKERI